MAYLYEQPPPFLPHTPLSRLEPQLRNISDAARKHITILESRRKLAISTLIFLIFVLFTLIRRDEQLDKMCPVKIIDPFYNASKKPDVIVSKNGNAAAVFEGFLEYWELANNSSSTSQFLELGLKFVELEKVGLHLIKLKLISDCAQIVLSLQKIGQNISVKHVETLLTFKKFFFTQCSWNYPKIFSFPSSSGFTCGQIGLICDNKLASPNSMGQMFFSRLAFELRDDLDKDNNNQFDTSNTTFIKPLSQCLI